MNLSQNGKMEKKEKTHEITYCFFDARIKIDGPMAPFNNINSIESEQALHSSKSIGTFFFFASIKSVFDIKSRMNIRFVCKCLSICALSK